MRTVLHSDVRKVVYYFCEEETEATTRVTVLKLAGHLQQQRPPAAQCLRAPAVQGLQHKGRTLRALERCNNRSSRRGYKVYFESRWQTPSVSAAKKAVNINTVPEEERRATNWSMYDSGSTCI